MRDRLRSRLAGLARVAWGRTSSGRSRRRRHVIRRKSSAIGIPLRPARNMWRSGKRSKATGGRCSARDDRRHRQAGARAQSDTRGRRATLAQSHELARAQAGMRYPQVGLTAGVGRQKYGAEFFGGDFRFPPFTYFAVGPTVNYTLDYTGGIARSIEQRQAQAEANRQQLDAAYLSVSGQAVMQAITIASLRAQIATLETILDQDRDNLRLVPQRIRAGSVARIDVVSAQSQIAKRHGAVAAPAPGTGQGASRACRRARRASLEMSCPRTSSLGRFTCHLRFP